MKKKLGIIGIFIVIMLLISATVPIPSVAGTTSEAYIPSETPIVKDSSSELEGNYLEYIETDSAVELKQLIDECVNRQNSAHDMAEAARALGYEEDHPIIVLAIEEWNNAKELYEIYKDKYESIILTSEYPVAAEVWIYLKNLGYNDYVCAGILGNMMAETGGGTLNIQWDIGTSHYGLCQWNQGYEGVRELDLQGQLDLLRDTIEYEIDTFGFVYAKGFDYDQFLALQDEEEAALAFAMAYERCLAQYYWCRADYAVIAYEYFTNF